MNINEKLEFVQGKVIVGIDIAKATHYLSIVDSNGKELKYGIPITNDREGFTKLENLLSTWPKDKIVIGWEPTGHYWKSVGYFLKELGYSIVLVNPYHVKLSKEIRDNNRGTNDLKDSLLIAHLIREGKHLGSRLLDGVFAEIRKLTLVRMKVSQDQARSVIRIKTLLDEYLPEYLTFFSLTTGKTCLGMLEKYGISGLRDSDAYEKKVVEITTLSRGRISTEKAMSIISAAQTSIGVISGQKSADRELKILLRHIRQAQADLQEIDVDLKEMLAQTQEAECLLTFKGIGVVTASTILGQTGSFQDFQNAGQIEKLAGLNLVQDMSGQYRGKKHIAKRGRDVLRNALYKVTLIAICKNQEFKQLYKYKVEQLKQNKMMALTAITSKIIRTIFGMLKTMKAYDGTLILKGLPV